MKERIDIFFERIRGKKVAFCGMGVTNTPLAELFLRRGFDVAVCDRARPERLFGMEKLEQLGAEMNFGEDYMQNVDADIIFRTPGIPFNSPEMKKCRERGAVITSELELFFELCPARIIAVTGSSGKTTTSSIIADALERMGKKVWLGGNIGRALMPDLEKMTADDIVVCELSSFQLISMRRSPDIAVVTNITPNHLDVHSGMEEYIQAKRNIFTHQNAFGSAVFNADCPVVSGFAGTQRGDCLTFSRREMPLRGAYADPHGDIWLCCNESRVHIMNISEIRIAGMHNVENYLAAICALYALAGTGTIDEQQLADAVRETAHLFRGVRHRVEFIRCLNGVSWYNDSIATTPTRTISGTLSLHDGSIILIAGGHDKALPFDELGREICRKVKLLILMGEAADIIENAVRSCDEFSESSVAVVRAENMEQAVQLAAQNAVDGDIVALSPACASFDMYRNFAERGDHFRKLVTELGAFSSRGLRIDEEDEEY